MTHLRRINSRGVWKRLQPGKDREKCYQTLCGEVVSESDVVRVDQRLTVAVCEKCLRLSRPIVKELFDECTR